MEAISIAVAFSLIFAPHALPADVVLVAPSLALAARRYPRTTVVFGIGLSLAYLLGVVGLEGMTLNCTAAVLIGCVLVAALAFWQSRIEITERPNVSYGLT
jgi:hypothetical protein